MAGDDRPEWRKRTDAMLREIEEIHERMTEQAARMQLLNKDISAMDLKELRAKVAMMEIQFAQGARDLGRIRERLEELGQGEEGQGEAPAL